MPRLYDYIPPAVRRQVAIRADYLCEYCGAADADSFIGFEIDHIISLKHGGDNTQENLAYSCPECNRNKGTDIASIDWETKQIERFFNPRIDNWTEHFRADSATIKPISVIGIVTVQIFRFNDDHRLEERQVSMF
jgi:5-methylcytosine-specific restriction endonuclease McrA